MLEAGQRLQRREQNRGVGLYDVVYEPSTRLASGRLISDCEEGVRFLNTYCGKLKLEARCCSGDILELFLAMSFTPATYSDQIRDVVCRLRPTTAE